MKKKLLFVIDSLACAGAEKSLVTLLSLLDYSKFSVDLMLFAHGEMLEELVPKEVNILKPLAYTEFAKLDFRQALVASVTKLRFRMISSRLKYSIGIRKNQYTNPQKARIYWQSVADVIEPSGNIYDVAISYAQGVPTFYVADKVKAHKKYAWVNVSYHLEEQDQQFQKKFYDCFTRIIAVSDSAKDIFLETFPDYSDKVDVIYDINDPLLIAKMAEVGTHYEDNYDGIRILTIGRLAHQKGYDIALEACKRLKDSGVNFRWYALGKGPLRGDIEAYIKEHGLEEHFILLGITANPYPYIKHCDIYVQTSRFEGFGLAIAEARMLNKPVVTTKFDAVYNQMSDRNNGLVVDMSAEAVCEGILALIHDKELNERIVSYLRTEKKGNVEELEKFYQLV